MTSKPNIVCFFVDDMGYGAVSFLNPAGRISTPGPRQKNDAPVDMWKRDAVPNVDATRFDDYLVGDASLA